jgi:hypothetical protein
MPVGDVDEFLEFAVTQRLTIMVTMVTTKKPSWSLPWIPKARNQRGTKYFLI